MTYHIYKNWQAGKHKAVIHRASCRHCNNGRGRSNGCYNRAHGEWHGPYDDLATARKEQQEMDVVARKDCQHCMKVTN